MSASKRRAPSDDGVQNAVREIINLFTSGGPVPPAAKVHEADDGVVQQLLCKARKDKATVHLTCSTTLPGPSPVDVLVICRPLTNEEESGLLAIIDKLHTRVQLRRTMRLLEEQLGAPQDL